MLTPSDPDLIWLVVLTFIFAFFLAFGVGANDVSNSFGTSVGSKVLTIKQATIFEILGAVLMGYQVSGTIRKGVFDINFYDGKEKLLIIGYLSALIGSSSWQIIATIYNLPISGTHSAVGAIIGFHLINSGFGHINYGMLGSIVLSWFISPVLSGIMSVILLFFIEKLIINHNNVLERGLSSLPIFYGFTLFLNVISIMTSGPKELYLNNGWLISIIISTLIGFLTGLIVFFIVVPKQRKTILKKIEKAKAKGEYNLDSSTPNLNTKINENDIEKTMITFEKTKEEPNNNNLIKDLKEINLKEEEQISLKAAEDGILKKSPTRNTLSVFPNNASTSSISSFKSDFKQKQKSQKSLRSDEISFSDQVPIKDDKLEVALLFKYLQILTACFASYAHGANDVSNAIGPLVGVLLIYQDGSVFQTRDSPVYVMLFGGMGISIGLWCLGRGVIQTLGNNLTKIVPSTGFTIETGAAFTVLLASKLGLPISTTMCKIGSVIMVGHYQGSKESVNWSLFNSVMLAWAFTIPISASLSAIAMFFLSLIDNWLRLKQY